MRSSYDEVPTILAIYAVIVPQPESHQGTVEMESA